MHNVTSVLMNPKTPNISVDMLSANLFNSLLPVTIFLGLEAVLGFIGNTLILCVYARLYLHCNFRYFVLFLAVYDLTSCVATIPGEIISEFQWYDYRCTWHCKTKSYLNVFTVWGSAFTLLLLAFDRYRKVCRPLGRQIQPSLALKLCAIGMFVSAVVAVPALFLWGTQTYIYDAGSVNVTVYICEKSGAYVNATYPFIYVTGIYILPIGFMMTAISIWNILIARKLFFRVLQIRSNTNTSENSSNRFTRNESESSDMSRRSFMSIDFRNMLCFRLAMFRRAESQFRPQNPTSIVSLSSCDFSEVPKTEHFYITTDFGKDQSTVSNVPDLEMKRNCKCLMKQFSNNSNSSEGNTATEELFERERRYEGSIFRRKRKTLIMLILTSVFIVTITVYIVLITLVAANNGIHKKLSNTEKGLFFFFLRIYFVNCVINPILYGLMDPRFRRGLKRLFGSCRLCR